MRQLVLHIPHSSTKIPYMDGYVVEDYLLEEEILKLTDWHTDELFFSEDDEMIVAEFSRIFCDPERFTDDSQEIMAQYGMGVLYERNDNGDKIRYVSPDLKNKVILEFYEKHHKKFSDAVNNQLNLFGKAIIIDCHSYPNIPLKRDLDQSPNRPDFNIGTDSYHTPKKLIDLSISFFEEAGYSLGIDKPYKGSIVPMEHYKKNKNVQTIMLEINRKLYLDEPSNNKNPDFNKIKQITSDFITLIRNTL